MVDAIAIPVLLKAVDWIFGESSKILQDRRERRKASAALGASVSNQDAIARSEDSSTTEINVKEDALRQPIEETLWKNAESHVKHLLSLLETYTVNYHLFREQYAKFGSAFVPPIVIHGLTEAEDKIAETTRDLQSVLTTVYGKKVTTSELERA
jgi:hypothetical protein